MTLERSLALLETLGNEGRKPALWLRDDDICADSPNLRLMFKVAEPGFPLVFAAVPWKCKFSDSELALFRKLPRNIYFCVHGHSHANHVAQGSPCEFPADRPRDAVTKEVQYGFRKVRGLFTERFIPMFVPPWNQIAGEHADALAQCGYHSVSGAKSVAIGIADPRLTTFSIDLDILTYGDDIWYPLKPAEQLDSELHQALTRWADIGDAAAPIGILSHHSSMLASDLRRYRELIASLVGSMRAFHGAPLEVLAA